jgi:hypothetical protein
MANLVHSKFQLDASETLIFLLTMTAIAKGNQGLDESLEEGDINIYTGDTLWLTGKYYIFADDEELQFVEGTTYIHWQSS